VTDSVGAPWRALAASRQDSARGPLSRTVAAYGVKRTRLRANRLGADRPQWMIVGGAKIRLKRKCGLLPREPLEVGMRLAPSILLLFLFLSLFPGAGLSQICVDDGDCSGDDACIAGLCIAPVDDPAAYAAAASARPSSYLRLLQLPALFEPDAEECCFDLDGDATIDDAFGNLLALQATLIEADYQGLLDEAIADLTLLRVFDWTELPAGLADGTARFSIFGALPADGVGQADLAAGTGSVILDRETFGEYGALEQFNDGVLASAVHAATGNGFSFTLPAETIELVFSLRKPRVEVPLQESAGGGCTGLCTIDEERAGDSPSLVGGGKLGGLVLADEYLAAYDAFYRTCTCSVADPEEPVLFWGEGASSYEVSCNTDNLLDPNDCDAGDPCGQLSTFCGTIAFLTTTLDADYDEDGIEDSWTAGFRFGLSGTQIDGVTLPLEIFSDDFESGGTSRWTVP